MEVEDELVVVLVSDVDDVDVVTLVVEVVEEVDVSEEVEVWLVEGLLVVIALVVEEVLDVVVVTDSEPLAMTAVWACCPLPSTVTMYFCPVTMLWVGICPWNRARAPMVIGPLYVKVAVVSGASA